MKISLLDILNNNGVNLAKRGLEYWAECPFHEDTNPSFSVSEANDDYIWYCFSCKKGGGPVEFLSEIENVPVQEAKRKYNEMCGIEIDIPDDRRLLNQIIEFMQKDFWDSDGGKYIAGRGFSREVAENCGLGYCNDMNYMLNLFSIDRYYAYQLGIPKDINRCVIYPFFDYDGCFKIHTRKIDNKEYMTYEGAYFKHSLWGLNRIRLAKGEAITLVEGFHDKMALEQHNIQAVSMQSTTMHKSYWDELFTHGIKDVEFAFDGDHAGREAMVRILENFDNRFNITFRIIPFGDPDEAISEDRYSQLDRLTMLEWYISYKHKKLDLLSDKINMYKDISKYYIRLSSEDKLLTKQHFKDKFGDNEALDYLYFDVKPDFKLEKIVIANCLYSDSIRYETLQKLDETAFFLRKHKELISFIRLNDATGTMVDAKFDEDFSNNVDLINYRSYIDDLKEISIRASLNKLLDKAKGRLGSENASQVVGSMMDEFYQISDNTTHIHLGSEIIKNVMKNISDRVNNPDVLGIPLNTNRFPILNKSLLGLVANKLILLSGITGHGKTIMANNLVDDLVFEKNEKVLFISLEMTPEELIERQLAIRAGISSTKILTGSLEQSEYDEIMVVAKRMLSDNLYIVYGVSDLYEIISIAKSMISRYKIRVVVLDYIQLISMKKRIDRWQQLMEISGALKKKICSKDVTTIALSQLNDNEDMNVRKQSGSKGMVNDVDVGIAIRQLRGNACKDGANFMINIDKHRYGADGILIPAIFDKSTLRIEEKII